MSSALKIKHYQEERFIAIFCFWYQLDLLAALSLTTPRRDYIILDFQGMDLLLKLLK